MICGCVGKGCTRTFAVGRLAPEAVRAHQVSVEICEALAAAAVPGARCEELYAMALGMAEKAGLEDRFMGLSASRTPCL